MQIDELIQNLPKDFTPTDIDLVMRAYRVAEKAHEGQKRASRGAVYLSLHCCGAHSCRNALSTYSHCCRIDARYGGRYTLDTE